MIFKLRWIVGYRGLPEEDACRRVSFHRQATRTPLQQAACRHLRSPLQPYSPRTLHLRRPKFSLSHHLADTPAPLQPQALLPPHPPPLPRRLPGQVQRARALSPPQSLPTTSPASSSFARLSTPHSLRSESAFKRTARSTFSCRNSHKVLPSLMVVAYSAYIQLSARYSTTSGLSFLRQLPGIHSSFQIKLTHIYQHPKQRASHTKPKHTLALPERAARMNALHE